MMIIFNDVASDFHFVDAKTGNYFGLSKDDAKKVHALEKKHNMNLSTIPDEFKIFAYEFVQIGESDEYGELTKPEEIAINRIKWFYPKVDYSI